MNVKRLMLLAGLCIAGAASAQSPVLAVIKFQDESGALPFQGGAGRVLTNMLTTELAARPAFTVVERQKLRDVLEEQALSESGRLSEGDNAKLGQLLGADYLVTGTVTAFEENIETKVCIFLFDMIYLNDESLLNKSLTERRALLRANIEKVENKVDFVVSKETTDFNEIQDFLNESVRSRLWLMQSAAKASWSRPSRTTPPTSPAYAPTAGSS